MEKRKKIMTTLILTTLLLCVAKETDAVNHSIYFRNTKNEKQNADQVEMPHDHLPEEDMVYTTIRKQHQFSALVKW